MFDLRKKHYALLVVLAFLVLLTACGGGGTYSSGATTTSSQDTVATTTQDAPIDGISCDPEMSSYHIHVRLFMWISGTLVQIPGTIGHGQSGCLYWLHTHSDDSPQNIIHIEAPQAFSPTLRNLLDIWQQTDASTFPNELTSPGWTIWVNGVDESASGSSAIIFQPHDVITMAYNTINVAPGMPSDYDWTDY